MFMAHSNAPQLSFTKKGSVVSMSEKAASSKALFRFVVFSLFGLFMFFFKLEWVSPTLKSVPVDFIVSWLQSNCMPAVKLFILAVMYAGAILPFVKKTWNKDAMNVFMSIAKVFGAVFGTIFYFGLWSSNAWLWRGDIGPFLFNKLAIPVGLVIPIGSMFLALWSSSVCLLTASCALCSAHLDALQ